jgi:hypothetical protein
MTDKDNEVQETGIVQMRAEVVMPAPVEQVLESWNTFQKIKEKILNKDDVQEIAGKTFIKRSGWQKIALAFNVSTTILEERRIDSPDFDFTYIIKVEARAPNGRVAEATGACSKSEKTSKNMPGTVHNVLAHATTRAMNRAISNLCGSGAVSAEEIDGEDAIPKATDKQVSSIEYRVRDMGGEGMKILDETMKKEGVRALRDLSKDSASVLIDKLKNPPKPQEQKASP